MTTTVMLAHVGSSVLAPMEQQHSIFLPLMTRTVPWRAQIARRNARARLAWLFTKKFASTPPQTSMDVMDWRLTAQQWKM